MSKHQHVSKPLGNLGLGSTMAAGAGLATLTAYMDSHHELCRGEDGLTLVHLNPKHSSPKHVSQKNPKTLILERVEKRREASGFEWDAYMGYHAMHGMPRGSSGGHHGPPLSHHLFFTLLLLIDPITFGPLGTTSLFGPRETHWWR